MITLGIETSCDETALCLIETDKTTQPPRYRILGQIINSQIDIHKEFGGVFPVMAKRAHAKNLVPLLEKMLGDSKIKTEHIDSEDSIKKIREILEEKESDLLEHILESSLIEAKPAIDQIAVTHGPGLEPALWVGVNFARALELLWNVPVIAANHMEGHIVGSLLPNADTSKEFQSLAELKLPALALLISGGHTELVTVQKNTEGNPTYEIIGKTRDDAVGEAYDKAARMMGLEYPGGPLVARYAEEARIQGLVSDKIKLPRPMLHSPDLHFSFSGLKTAVLYLIRDLTNGTRSLTNEEILLISKEFEDAITEVLIAKTKKALGDTGSLSLIVGGGVIANAHIRKSLENLCTKTGATLHLPPLGITGDNAVMIALAGALNPHKDDSELAAHGNLSLGK